MGINTFDFTPDPISLLESNRNLGYSIEEAISDLIDNSISARAKQISYEIHWNDGDPYFLLKDNGMGMCNEENELINSFRLGSKNPLEERDDNDLGRFGFGMKTASLSQARALTVITKKSKYKTIALSLDLDFITENKKWLLKTADENKFKDEFKYLSSLESGTIIRWDHWDRAPKSENDFMSLITVINNYLSVCFHRYLDKGISISHHDYPLQSCSPIPNDNERHYSKLQHPKNEKVVQTSWILKHPKAWDEEYENISQFNSYSLFNGFERQQGIYIYRCDRLLTPYGGWFGLIRSSNATKLARVTIDYPNDADELWSLDITKTNASIPLDFKNEIKKLIDVSRNGSVKKIVRGNRHVTQNLSKNNSRIWKLSDNREFNSYKYEIDIKHPVFSELINQKKIKEKDLKNILKLISNNLPVAKIIDNNDKNPSKHDKMVTQHELSETDIEIAKILFRGYNGKMPKSVAFNELMNFEPYCFFEKQLEDLLL